MRNRQSLTENSSPFSSGQRRKAFGHFLIILMLALFALAEPGSTGERRRTRRASSYPSAAATQAETAPAVAINVYSDPENYYQKNGPNSKDQNRFSPAGRYATPLATGNTRLYPPPRLPDLDLEVPIIDYSRGDPRPQEKVDTLENEPEDVVAEFVIGDADNLETSLKGRDSMPSSQGDDAKGDVDPDTASDAKNEPARDGSDDTVLDSGRKTLGYLDGELIEDIQVPVPASPRPQAASSLAIAENDLNYGEWKDYQPRVYIEPITTSSSFQVIEPRSNKNRGIIPRTRYQKTVSNEDNDDCKSVEKVAINRLKDLLFTKKQQAVPQPEVMYPSNIPDDFGHAMVPLQSNPTQVMSDGYSDPSPYAAPSLTVETVPLGSEAKTKDLIPIPESSCAVSRPKSPASKAEIPEVPTKTKGIIKRTGPILPKTETPANANDNRNPEADELDKPKAQPEAKLDYQPETKPKNNLEGKPEVKPNKDTFPEIPERIKEKPEAGSPSKQSGLMTESPWQDVREEAFAVNPDHSLTDEEFYDKYYFTKSSDIAIDGYIENPEVISNINHKKYRMPPQNTTVPPVVLPKLSFQTPKLGQNGQIPPPQSFGSGKGKQEAEKTTLAEIKSQQNHLFTEKPLDKNLQKGDVDKQDKHQSKDNTNISVSSNSASVTSESRDEANRITAEKLTNSRLNSESMPASTETAPPPAPPMRPETLAMQEPWRQPAPPPPPTRAEVEAYRSKLEQRLLERYNNLPDHSGQVAKVTVVLSKPVEVSLDGNLLRAEFDQLVYDPWGKRIPDLEQEYFAVTFGAGGPQQVRSEPSIRIGLDQEAVYSEHAPLPADPFKIAPADSAFKSNPQVKMPNWWRPEFR